jgi:hypothetical protein
MKDHELCFSVCRFIENCSEMQTNSLLTTAIDLQNPPRDVHKFIAGHCSQSSETAPRCTQIHYQPPQSIFRISPEMHTNSLPITAINLQKQPRDAHKFITNHSNQSSETAQRCTQIPAKDFVGQFKGPSPGTTWSKVCHGAHCKLCLRLSLTQPSTLCYSLQSDCQLAKCFSFQPQNVICKRRWNSALAEVEEENVTTIFAPLLLCFI